MKLSQKLYTEDRTNETLMRTSALLTVLMVITGVWLGLSRTVWVLISIAETLMLASAWWYRLRWRREAFDIELAYCELWTEAHMAQERCPACIGDLRCPWCEGRGRVPAVVADAYRRNYGITEAVRKSSTEDRFR